MLLAGFLFAACQKSGKNSPYPQISFKYLTPDSVKAGLFSDTAYFAFDFYDGDGDIGTSDRSTTIYMIDSRDSSLRRYPFPYLSDPEAHDPNKGTEGSCLVILQGATLIPRPDSLHTNFGDTVRFSTYIIDDAGNESNRFTTPNLYIRPR